ncbi:hypothetical protein Ddye_011156 [Dipteronia dyeriana]|uniref:UDP-glycosyltransferase n=1 Tax=Dipteronia dyeriana TaxID=168575 RepID=A0AAE0CP01_9ROSI|nr:hypothetical protein Ddye_011156 [Dipteronia dyeriana]
MAAKAQPHNDHQLNVFFFPFMSPGNLIPMTDMARIFASHGTKATIIATSQNISRFQSIIDRDDHRQSVNILKIDFSFAAADLSPNCESLDSPPSRGLTYNFSKANWMLQPQADDLVRRYRPDAIVSDFNLPWAAEIARKLVTWQREETKLLLVKTIVSWLDSKEPNSVLYVCFGSLCEFTESQLWEIASGLEPSKASFIWVVKDSGKFKFLTEEF